MGIPWPSIGQDSALSLPVPGSIPGWGTKILQAMQCDLKKKKKERKAIKKMAISEPGSGPSKTQYVGNSFLFFIK